MVNMQLVYNCWPPFLCKNPSVSTLSFPLPSSLVHYHYPNNLANSVITSCNDLNLLNQSPLTPSGPGAFQFAIFRIPCSTSLISIFTSFCFSIPLVLSLTLPNQVDPRHVSSVQTKFHSKTLLPLHHLELDLTLPCLLTPCTIDFGHS